jgi:LmbE family N-acetylglucosaminyl deacetylase
MRVVCIGSSPTEVLTRCAGLLLRYGQAGVCRATVITPSENTAFEHTYDGLTLQVPEGWELRESDIDTQSTRERLTGTIREPNPDVVIGPTWRSTAAHRRLLAEWLFNATYAATVPNFEVGTDLPVTKSRTPILEYDDPRTAAFLPTDFVDVTSVWSTRADLLEAVGVARGDDAFSESQELARFRGIQARVAFAEAYGRTMTWGRVGCGSLLPR